MHINRNYYKSRGLPDENIDFLERIVPLCRTISTWTHDKAYDRDDPIKTQYGVFPSVILAFCILRSVWGSHPVAQKRFEGVDDKGKAYKRHGNNLARIYADRSWQERKRPVILYEGSKYKSYKDDSACAVDLSDIIALRYNHAPLLLATTVKEQIEHLSTHAEFPETFKLSIGAIIYQMELWQFDK